MNKQHFFAFLAIMAMVVAIFAPVSRTPAHAATTIPGLASPRQSIMDPTTDKTYVAGTGNTLAVVDNSTDSLVKYITLDTTFDISRGTEFFVNPVTNMVYVFIIETTGSQVFVIDSTTDTVVNSATLVGAYGATFDSVTNRLYVKHTDSSSVAPVWTLVAYDGTTLAPLDSVNINSDYGGPSILALDSQHNRMYVLYTGNTSAFGIKAIDLNTDATIAQSPCNATLGCGTLRFGGQFLGASIDPTDGSLWLSSDTTVGGTIAGGDNGGGGFFGGTGNQSEVWHFNPTTGIIDQFYGVAGIFYLSGVDPVTGMLYGTGLYLPIGNNGMTDLVFTNPTLGVDHSLGLIGIADSLTNLPGGCTVAPVAFDFGSRNIYWQCAKTTATTEASIVITKMSYTPLAGFAMPEFASAFVKQFVIPSVSGIDNLMYYEVIQNIGVSDFPYLFNQLPTDSASRAFFYSTGDDFAVDLNPTALTAAKIQFTAPQFIPDPPPVPTFSVQGKITDTSGFTIQGVPVTITDGTTTITTATSNLGGWYTFPAMPAGTYTVSYDPTGLIPSGPTSQTVTVTNANITGVNFQALTTPIAITSVTWPAVPGTPMNFTAGQLVGGFVQLNQPAPAGGIVVTLTSSNAKALKVPATLTILAGSSGTGFSAQAQGVTVMTYPTVTASYQGTFAPAGASGTSPTITVYPSESVKVTSATWSKSSTVLTVTATDNVTFAALSVQDAKTGAILGSMSTSGNGSYTFQTTIATPPSSVNVLSSISAKVGQGVSTVN